jgi:hypothetical protein
MIPVASFAIICLVLGVLAYLPTLQTIPNGSDHYYMVDVGETQAVLNVWGTLHATGYPHYILLTAPLVSALRTFGISAAAAPAITSLAWMLVAFAVLWVLIRTISPRVPLLVVVLLFGVFGLARTLWIHAIIAEIYAFTLLWIALLLLAVLAWQPSLTAPNALRKVLVIALLGGIATAHHRAIVLLAPALIYALWPELTRLWLSWERGRVWRMGGVFALAFAVGCLGLIPYLYLPLRDWATEGARAAWVYGKPGMWQGFLDQFWGREASGFIGTLSTLPAVLGNFDKITQVLLLDVSPIGLMLGIVGLALGVWNAQRRRVALTLLIGGVGAYVFHGVVYSDVLSTLILIVLVSALGGWALLFEWLFDRVAQRRLWRMALYGVTIAYCVAVGAWLYRQNFRFLYDLTHDTRGLALIAAAEQAPPNSTLILGWGPLYGAAGFAKDVLGQMPHLELSTHNTDVAALARSGQLLTPWYAFFAQPQAWWEARIGAPVYLHTASPELIAIAIAPTLTATPRTAAPYIDSATLDCRNDQVIVRVLWGAGETPTRDQSVFVHLVDADGHVLAQADQSAPVHGLRPLTTWQAGELIQDVYVLPRDANGTAVNFGLYYQDQGGGFVNTLTQSLAVSCS